MRTRGKKPLTPSHLGNLQKTNPRTDGTGFADLRTFNQEEGNNYKYSETTPIAQSKTKVTTRRPKKVTKPVPTPRPILKDISNDCNNPSGKNHQTDKQPKNPTLPTKILTRPKSPQTQNLKILQAYSEAFKSIPTSSTQPIPTEDNPLTPNLVLDHTNDPLDSIKDMEEENNSDIEKRIVKSYRDRRGKSNDHGNDEKDVHMDP